MTDKDVVPWVGAIKDAKRRFVAISDEKTWLRESSFAMQLIQNNNYLMSIANKNPESLRFAVSNVAAIGLSLNPATAFAHLVPRDGAACLDISYKGLIKLATDSGAIAWAQAENVYSNDRFEFYGPVSAPDHKFDPFSKDRGDYQGTYCVARTANGDILAEAMPASEIIEIRDKSEMYKKTGKGPWKDFFGEMAKKTVIKRASKTWPKSTGGQLEKAINFLNEEGEGIKFAKDVTEVHDTYTIGQKEKFQELLNNEDSLGLYLLERSIPVSAWIDLFNTGEQGQKVKMKQRVNAMSAQGLEIVDAIKDACERLDEHGLAELIEDSDKDLLSHLPALLGPENAAEFINMTYQEA